MSFSVVLALVFGMPGTAEVLVMAAALGLFLAVALWRAARRGHAIVPVGSDASVGGALRPRPVGLLSGRQRRSRAQQGRPPVEASVADAAAAGPVEPERVSVIGYSTFSSRAGKESDKELARQAEVIARACDQRRLTLVEMVSDADNNRRLFRPKRLDPPPGLSYALERIAAGDAQGLVVSGLRRLTRSAAELGPIVEWFVDRGALLVAVAQGFDSAERADQVAARLIIEVSRWEREGLWDPPSESLSPSSGVPSSAVASDEPHGLSRWGGESS
jgi:hypothetical protein